jgi:hypothetical protein
MRTTTILSATALLLSSLSAALPTPDLPSLSLREDATINSHVATIEARTLSPADTDTYLKMKSLQAQTANYETQAHKAVLNAMNQKNAANKATYQNAATLYYAKLCTMWTQ